MRKTLIISALSLLSSVFLAAQYGGDKSNTIPASGGSSPLAQTAWGCVSNYSTAPTCTATSGSSATAGDPLVAYIQYSGGFTISAPTGCATSWTLVSNNATDGVALYKASVLSTGSCAVTETAVYSSADQFSMIIAEAKSAVASTTVDTFSFTGDLFGCTSCSLASVTTTVNNDVLIAFAASGGNGTFTVSSPFTLDNGAIANQEGGGCCSLSAYQVLASAGTTNLSFTSTTATNGPGATIALEP